MISSQSYESQEPPKNCERLVDKNKVVSPKELESFDNKELFVTLDSQVSSWESHTLLVVNLCLTPKQYFRGDVLRVLFYYILNGPDENVMYNVKDTLLRHFNLHSPCSDTLRTCYKNLLFDPYAGCDFDFPKNITEEGIWCHLFGKFETLYKLDKLEMDDELEPDEEHSFEPAEPPALELLEKRYYNYEPLLDKELEQSMGAWDYLANFNWNETADKRLKPSVAIKRLNVVLKLLVHLLQEDFKSCVSMLKQQVGRDSSDQVKLKPLVGYFTYEECYSTLFKLYLKTKDEDLWILLSQLFELMAEYIEIFISGLKTNVFPLADEKCKQFANEFFSHLKENSLEKREEWRRLRMLRPPWFQHQVIMSLRCYRPNLNMSSDLKGTLNIMNLNITNEPCLEEEDTVKVPSPKYIMKSYEQEPHQKLIIKIEQLDELISKIEVNNCKVFQGLNGQTISGYLKKKIQSADEIKAKKPE